MALGIFARGAVATAVAAVAAAGVTAESLPGLFVSLTYHQVTLVHSVVVSFSPPGLLLLLLLLLLHLLLLLLLLYKAVTATQWLRHTLQNNNHSCALQNM